MGTARSTTRPSEALEIEPRGDVPARSGGTNPSHLAEDERSQIAARLRLSPNERLRYLEDMIAFEELARRARRLT